MQNNLGFKTSVRRSGMEVAMNSGILRYIIKSWASFQRAMLSSQATIIYIMFFLMQIVTKQRYSIKQWNSVSK